MRRGCTFRHKHETWRHDAFVFCTDKISKNTTPLVIAAYFIRTISWKKKKNKKAFCSQKCLTTFKVKRCAHRYGKRSTAIGYYNIYNMVKTHLHGC